MDGAMTTLPRHQPESFDSQCSNDRISPRNSKWLQQNITDMDAKVKAVMTLVEEDASSFNRKAEMYFKKRPELMNLIEELYRAYRALAERYDYTTGELQWFQKAITKASAYSPSPQTPQLKSRDNESIGSDNVVERESGIRELKKTLISMGHEKEIILLKYQQTMKKLSDIEDELKSEEESFKGLSEQASEAKKEVEKLKEAIAKVEVERDAAFLHQKELIARISSLESRILHVREEGAPRTEIRSKCLENEVSRLETEKETSFSQYKKCLEKKADLERKLSLAENEAGLLHKRAYRAESEGKKLRIDLDLLNEEKKSVAFEYENCLVQLSNLESELSLAQDEMRRMNSEVLIESEKLNTAEEKYANLEISNKSLKSEAMFSELKIEMKEKELYEKHQELEKLQACLQNEKLRCLKVEAAILAFQNFLSQEENGSSNLEIREVVQLLKDFDISQYSLEQEQEIAPSVENLKNGVLELEKIKEKLEEEIGLQKGLADTLQNQVYVLKDDIKDLKFRYQSLTEKIKSLGLNPECVGSSLKDLKDENSMLREIYEENRDEKEALLKKMDSMEQLLSKNVNVEKSVHWLNEDKLALVSEKAALLSQLRTITNCVEKLTEKNIVLENPLYVANIELENLKTKSENMGELFESLHSESSNFFGEKSRSVLALDNVQRRLESLENRFSEAEKKCLIMEKDREPTLSRVEDLKFSLDLEKRERSSLELSSEARLASLEKHLDFLKEETKWSKIEFEEEINRAVSSHFEIFILHIFIQDLEMKNHALSMECEKHVESSNLRENLVSELERENLEQQVEIELFISEIEKLRGDISRVFKALEISPDNEPICVNHVIENIENMKGSLSSYKDDKQKLILENSILVTLLDQLISEGTEITREKNFLNQELERTYEELKMVKNSKNELQEINEQLISEIKEEKQSAKTLKAEIEKLHVQQRGLEKESLIREEKLSKALGENKSLMKSFVDLKNEKLVVEEENDYLIMEALVLDNNCTAFKNFGTEKAMEIDVISRDLQNLTILNSNLEKENLSLKDSVKKLEKKLNEADDLNNHLKKGISDEMKIICEKEMELCLVEEKLKATEDLNLELCKTLKEQNSKLFEENKNQSEEIMFLRESNENLSSEIEDKKIKFADLENQFRNQISAETVILCQKDIEFSLSEDVFERKHEETMLSKQKLENQVLELTGKNENQGKEIQFLHEINKNLNHELREMKKETEVWEVEASTFHFDLQISKAYEVVLENKVRELSSVCKILENENFLKSGEVGKMKERVDVMESEIGSFKAELCSYAPAIDTIRENMVLLEQKVLDQPEIKVDHDIESKDEKEPEKQVEELKSPISNRLQELMDLQTRIKSLERVITEKKQQVVTQKNTFTEIEPVVEQEDELKEEMNPKFLKTKTEMFLDSDNEKQRGNSVSSPLQEENESSVDKIETLEKTVQDLKTKTERNKKRKIKSVDFEIMKKQLTEVEEKLKISPEEKQIDSHTKALSRIESEKTKHLKLEIQAIKNVFSKMENRKKSRGKVRILRFFRIWRRSERSRRKGLFGCCRSSSNGQLVSNNR